MTDTPEVVALLAEVRQGRALREAVRRLAEELGSLPGLRERKYVASRLRDLLDKSVSTDLGEFLMTTRHSGYQIILSDNIREDDAKALINTLYMIKGVARVVPIEADYSNELASARRDSEWAMQIRGVLDRMKS